MKFFQYKGIMISSQMVILVNMMKWFDHVYLRGVVITSSTL